MHAHRERQETQVCAVRMSGKGSEMPAAPNSNSDCLSQTLAGQEVATHLVSYKCLHAHSTPCSVMCNSPHYQVLMAGETTKQSGLEQQLSNLTVHLRHLGLS